MNVLVTGGAGFIGSSIVDELVARGHTVRILDDFSTGFEENVNPRVEVYRGEVSDEDLVRKAVAGVEVVFHEAAHRAVARSVEDPLATDRANTYGTLCVLKSALDAGARRVVFAGSSSVYGGAAVTPTPETYPARPKSPYAVTKFTGEQYCRVFAELYGLETVVLRYFNVFGPKQRPDSMYAAVIPLFIEALRAGERPVVHGDGLQDRDFTFIGDTVAANMLAMEVPADACSGKIFNIACGGQHSLLELLAILGRITGVEADPVHTEPRAGDVRNSCADIGAASAALGYTPSVSFEDGLRRTVEWFDARRAAG